MSRRHSPLLVWFIYFLVAMTLFSAIGIIAIYLKAPQRIAPGSDLTGDNATLTGDIGTGTTLTGTKAPAGGFTIPEVNGVTSKTSGKTTIK